MNENCSVAAGERMYSEAMRKIAERRHLVYLHVSLSCMLRFMLRAFILFILFDFMINNALRNDSCFMFTMHNKKIQVVRAAMEHVASIKCKGRAAGPHDAQFQRLYNPMQARPATKSRKEEHSSNAIQPRPRSAPRPKSNSRLLDESNHDFRNLEAQGSNSICGRQRVNFDDAHPSS